MFQVREHYTKVSHWVKGEFQIDIRVSAAARRFEGPLRDDWDVWDVILIHPYARGFRFFALTG